jgi:hypothetical protein
MKSNPFALLSRSPFAASRLRVGLAVGALLGFGVLGPNLAVAQEDGSEGIKVKVVYYPDKSRKETQTDLSAGTSEAKNYDAANHLTRQVTYKLDEKGQESEGSVLTAKGTVSYSFAFSRNSLGQISEERDFSPNGDLIRRLVYHYGSAGNVTGVDTFDAQGNLIPAGPAKKPHKSQ